ncbi:MULTISPECIES: hypothetical protein [unclassified Caldicellulosiruptor]|uniref:hypothetical protein n=1 Tax=unclassified Caldicellulosiruptor TaxID=2622462 RepID=UPI0003A4BDEB|nr:MULTISPECIES: hypothetical protein [unclassified Caldicellulosiruptor]
MKIKIYTKRLGISIAVLVFGIVFIFLLIKYITVRNVLPQEDNINYLKKLFGLKNAQLVESDIKLEKLPDETFMYKYLFEDDKSKYEIYMKESQSVVYFKKYQPSDVVNDFSFNDVKSKAFKLLYKFAPYTKGNVELYVTQTKDKYICNFYRVEGDKKVLSNEAVIVLNKDNGELLEFEINWFSNINFKTGSKKGNEEEKILKSIKIVPAISSDSFLKYTTLNNILSLKDLYFDYVEGKVFPEINLNPNKFNLQEYNNYVDYVQKKASVEYVKLKFGKILNMLSSQQRRLPFSLSEFKIEPSGGYSYKKDSLYGKVEISADKFGNILKMTANLKASGNIKKVEAKVLNDRAEQLMQTLLGKFVTAKSYIFDNEKEHAVSYKFYIGGAFVMAGKLNISFDKLSGEVTTVDFDLGLKPEFMEKAKEVKDTAEYLKLVRSSGFEEVYVLTKDYGKVYLFEKSVDAHLALKPKFDLTYLMNATK